LSPFAERRKTRALQPGSDRSLPATQHRLFPAGAAMPCLLHVPRILRIHADAVMLHTFMTNGENAMSSVGYHEPVTELSDETRDMHRAIVSLMEELEAVDWYNQRADACKDPELKAILLHNRDEEKEHAAMVLEWIRRKDPRFSKEMKDYLFTDKPIAHK
jgi:hypothetical protein